MFCFKCEKKPETTNEREEEHGEWIYLKGVCKVCNIGKTKRLRRKNKYANIKLLI